MNKGNHSALLVGLSCAFLVLSGCNLTDLIFNADKTYGPRLPSSKDYDYAEVHFPSKNGKRLEGWFFQPRIKEAKGTVLHFHGNSGNISYQFHKATIWVDHGYQLLTFDYQGYGKSQGRPSQQNILEDASASLTYLLSRPDIKRQNLILFGQSLGGHLAIAFAVQAQDKFKAMVIESPFTSYKEIMSYHANRFGIPKSFTSSQFNASYRAIDMVQNISIPKLFIHPKNDQVVPFYMGKSLYDKAVQPKRLWTPKAKHENTTLEHPDEFIKQVEQLLDSLRILNL